LRGETVLLFLTEEGMERVDSMLAIFLLHCKL